MNYNELFKNMAKSLTGKEINPADIGNNNESRPTSIPSDSITEGFKNGSIAGQLSSRLLDKKEHFPVFTETQARSSMSRTMQLREVPVWYNGNLSELRQEVFEGIARAHPHLIESLNVNVPASKVIALSDGMTSSETSKTNIDDPADVVKTLVPSVKRPTITTAEVAKICENSEFRTVIAGKLLECIEQQEQDVLAAKQLASQLLKKGLTKEQFDGLSTYLQSDVLRELLYSKGQANLLEDRRLALLEKLNKKD